MSNPREHDSPTASNAAWDLKGPRCSNVNFDQQSGLTSAQPRSSASSDDRPFLLLPSSGFADETINPPFGYPSNWNSESTLGFGHPSAYGHLPTLDNPLASSEQSLSVYRENADLIPGNASAYGLPPVIENSLASSGQSLSAYQENADLDPEIGQSTASDAFEATEQEQPSFGASADEMFQVSFASESDLEKLSDVHARVSIDNPLACCTILKPMDFPSHLELARFHYGQAFAAKTGAVVLKVTNQVSGDIVGCAWLQVLFPLEKRKKRVPISRPGVPLPSCLKKTLYGWIYDKAHNHRRRAVKKGLQNYCKYLPSPFSTISPKGLELMRSGNTIINVCLLVVRSLDVLDTLSVEHQSQVHRTLVLFVSEFEPECDVFLQLRESHLSDMLIFLDAGWKFTGDQILDPWACLKYEFLISSLQRCPMMDRILSGLLRVGVVKARAQPQTLLSHAWPSPVAEVCPPRSLSLTTNPATWGHPDELSPKEQQDHDSGRASKKRARSGKARKAQQQVGASEEQGPSSAQFDQQTLAGQQPLPSTVNSQQPVGTPQSHERRVPPNEQYGQSQLGPPQRPTITVNFVADGAQIFERPTQSVTASFNYLSYRKVSTAMTVNDLISKLRLQNAMLKGVTMAFEMTVGDGSSALRKWGAGMTILQGSEMAEWTLAEVGWGPEASPLWLVVKM